MRSHCPKGRTYPLKLNLRLSRIMTISDRSRNWGSIGVNGKQKTAESEVPAIPRIDASTLLASAREIILVHKETQYRLRITSNDKLILTK